MSFKNILFVLLLVNLCGCTASEKIRKTNAHPSLKNITVDENTHPVVILGGGVGGLTAAVYLAQAGFEPLIIQGNLPGGLITQSSGVENWPGEIKISGIELSDKIKAQALRCGAKIVDQKVDSVDFSTWPYKIEMSSIAGNQPKQLIKALSCIIVMGSQPNLLNIPGESGPEGYFGKGVTTCAVCDGALYKDKTVAVIGGGNSAMAESLYLSALAKKVFVIVRSDKLKATHNQQELVRQKPNVEFLFNTKVIQISGDKNHVKSLIIENTKTDINDTEKVKELPIDGVFLAIGSKPNTQIFRDQLDLTEHGFIKISDHQETSKPGVYAAGDISDDKFKQAITAAGDATKAALQAIDFLQNIGYTPTKRDSKKNKSTDVSQNIEITGIKSEKEFDGVLSKAKDKLVVADFYATYCVPCQNMAPVFKQLAEEFKNSTIFIKINVSENSELAKRFSLSSVPTFLFFRNGKVLKKLEGARSFDSFKNEIQKSRSEKG